MKKRASKSESTKIVIGKYDIPVRPSYATVKK
jgi:hypothetical protein